MVLYRYFSHHHQSLLHPDRLIHQQKTQATVKERSILRRALLKTIQQKQMSVIGGEVIVEVRIENRVAEIHRRRHGKVSIRLNVKVEVKTVADVTVRTARRTNVRRQVTGEINSSVVMIQTSLQHPPTLS